MSDRYTLECYNSNGDLAFPPQDVDSPIQALFELGKRLALDYVHATCYLHRDTRVFAQWELEIK